jgi:hypothetical protein
MLSSEVPKDARHQHLGQKLGRYPEAARPAVSFPQYSTLCVERIDQEGNVASRVSQQVEAERGCVAQKHANVDIVLSIMRLEVAFDSQHTSD